MRSQEDNWSRCSLPDNLIRKNAQEAVKRLMLDDSSSAGDDDDSYWSDNDIIISVNMDERLACFNMVTRQRQAPLVLPIKKDVIQPQSTDLHHDSQPQELPLSPSAKSVNSINANIKSSSRPVLSKVKSALCAELKAHPNSSQKRSKTTRRWSADTLKSSMKNQLIGVIPNWIK